MTETPGTAGRAPITVNAGDMEAWSDLTGPRPIASGRVFTELAARTAEGAGRVLLAGPHDLPIIDQVVAGAAHTTVLMRSAPDATTIADRYAGRSVDVVCGDVEGFTPVELYDAVIALGGLEALVGIDREPVPVASLHARLMACGRPDARLAIAIDNPASVLALLRLPQAEAADDDAAWFPALDRSQPAARDLAGEGVTVLAGWPEPHRPTLLTSHEVEDGLRALVLAHAAPGSTAAVLDVRLATARAMAAHRAASLAPLHVLVRGGACPQTVDGTLRADRRDTLVEGPALAGSLWMLDVLDACAGRDLRRLRPLASALRDAVAADPQGWSRARVDDAVTTADGTVALLHRHHAISGGTSEVVADVDDVALGLIDDVVAVLRASGWRHPWPAGVGHEEQTVLLAAEADLSASDEDVERARAARAVRLAEAGVEVAAVPAVVDADRLSRVGDENRALRGQVAWFKVQLRQRAQLIGQLRAEAREEKRRLQRRIQQLRGDEAPVSPSFAQKVRRRVRGRLSGR